MERVPDHPGIYRKGGRYYDTWKERGKPRKRAYPTLTAAVRGRAERIASGNRPASRERFDKYARRWIEDYRGRTKKGLDEDSRDEYRKIIEQWLIPHFRHTALGDIGPDAVHAFIDHLCRQKAKRTGEPLAAATIRWIMAPLKAMLAEAYEKGLITVDASRVRIVVPERKRTTRRRARPRTLTAAQTAAVLDAVPARYRLLFVLLACTGLRISEALGLQWRDLEQTPDGPILVIERQFYCGKLKDSPKTEAGDRCVALIPALVRELMRHRANTDYPAPQDPIFATKYGTHISAHNVRRMLRPKVAELGLGWATPHVFRHSLATALRDAGHDATAIARVLGHADPGFTQRTYIHAPQVVRFDNLRLGAFEGAEGNPEGNQRAETGGNS